jgi:type II secretory ATPase GspE/PulE/Tfp pilus assembly ATPase PilB-like protein
MQRWLWIALLAGGVGVAWLSPPAVVYAQEAAAEAGDEAAPAPQLDRWNDAHSIPRVSRPMIAWPELLVIWLLFLLWVKSADWVNRDAQIFELGYGLWNPILFFPFLAVLLLFAFPVVVGFANFIVAAIALSVIFLATFFSYVVTRNKAVELHQKVFTPDWFRYEAAVLGNKIGVNISSERKEAYEKGPPVELLAVAADEERVNQANLLTARQSPGYILVKELIAEMVDRRSDRVALDYTQQSVVARHHIDGVWHSVSAARDRESGDVMLAVMKTLANMDMRERRKRQASMFAARYDDNSYVCPIVSEGVKTGERVVVDFLPNRRDNFRAYAELGMREKLAEQWGDLMGRDQGLLIIAGLPEGGVTTLTSVSLMETDRLLRDFASVEDERQREREIENIDVVTYDPAKGETPATVLPKLIRKYPNVYIVRDLADPEAARLLLDEVSDSHLVLTNARAKEAPEALLRMLQMKVPQREFAASVTAVLCTRLIRKLCESCRVAYEPGPELLKKLGIPAGKVSSLYRVPKPEEADKPCRHCGGLGFFGRTGLFELLVVDEPIREILRKQPKLDLLQKAARPAGMRTFQEEGLLLVAKGVTSLAELQRVLKQ